MWEPVRREVALRGLHESHTVLSFNSSTLNGYRRFGFLYPDEGLKLGTQTYLDGVRRLRKERRLHRDLICLAESHLVRFCLLAAPCISDIYRSEVARPSTRT